MTYSPDGAVAAARHDVGYHEGANNYNRYSPWQGLSPFNPWCASAACYWACVGGGYRFPGNCTFGEKGEAYVPTLIERAKQEGLWRPTDWRALPGDLVMYDWGHDGVADHVEQVDYDDSVTLMTIGGNTSDAVLFRTRPRSAVVGFYALSQSTQVTPALDPKVLADLATLIAWGTSVSAPNGELRLNDRGPRVKTLNDLLVARGLEARTGNAYGAATRAAVHHFKLARRLSNADGTVFGAEAVRAILHPNG